MAATLSLAFAPTPAGADQYLVVYAAPPVSPGVNFVPRSKFRFLQATALNGASPVNLLAAYEAKFGSLVAGSRVFVRAKLITTEGFTSQELVTSFVITPGA